MYRYKFTIKLYSFYSSMVSSLTSSYKHQEVWWIVEYSKLINKLSIVCMDSYDNYNKTSKKFDE